VLCSSARRTRETLDLLGDAAPARCDVRVEDGLYEATADALLNACARCPAAVTGQC
jgi:phosphohistidine phosphatase SixA